MRIEIINEGGTGAATRVLLDGVNVAPNCVSATFAVDKDRRPVVVLELLPDSFKAEGEAEVLLRRIEEEQPREYPDEKLS